MPVLNGLVKLLFLPGTFVLSLMGIGVEEDCGVARSFINSSVWGAIALGIGLKFFT